MVPSRAHGLECLAAICLRQMNVFTSRSVVHVDGVDDERRSALAGVECKVPLSPAEEPPRRTVPRALAPQTLRVCGMRPQHWQI